MAERKIHGPIFQFECEVCDFMGDCWDTEAEAVADMEAHDCVACAPAWVRDEIEWLRAAGDALHAWITVNATVIQQERKSHDEVLNGWEEARRG